MKAASTATKNILATGTYKKAELFAITLAGGGATSYFTSADYQIVVGGNTYLTGLAITRGPVKQSVGLNIEGLDLEIWPQQNNPAGMVTFGGLPFLQACRAGVLDGARLLMSKIFLSSWSDTSPGAVPWFQGRINRAMPGRASAKIYVNSDLELLDVQMPRNLVMTGCSHSLFDAGCTLNPATFQVSGIVAAGAGILTFNTNLTQANNYWNLGRITFTSGPNNGLKRVVRSSLNASGALTLLMPLPVAPLNGNTFTILPECTKTQAACSNTSAASGPPFNNLAHFRGQPYVPNPETLYDGGTANGQAPVLGGQGGAGVGSGFSGRQGPGTYKP